MPQHPPPFKRFARERFDGSSLYGQRPASPGGSYQNSSRIPVGPSPHSQQGLQPTNGPMVERTPMEHSTHPHFTDVGPRYASDESRLQEEMHSSHSVSPIATDAPYPWRLRAPAQERPLSTSTVSQRRQQTALWNENGQRHVPARVSSVHLLPHSQLRPYSIAGDHVPRSVSQPNTPSFYPHTQQHNLDEPPPSNRISDSSSHPATSRRRVRSATGNGEANFTDEEFHLFVQATAGLGPEQSYRNPNSSYDALDNEDLYPRTGYATRTESDRVSPEQNSPTTSWAFQQTASMPLGTQGSQQQEVAMSRPPMQRLETSPSALDLWLQPPSAAPDDDYVVSPIEDELPDYATSQAQAQAEQRIEAARRAKELRRRWEESRH